MRWTEDMMRSTTAQHGGIQCLLFVSEQAQDIMSGSVSLSLFC